MKAIIKLVGLCVLISALFACAGGGPVQTREPVITPQPENTPESSSGSPVLDTAIAEAAAYFVQRLPDGAKVAIVSFDTPTGRLSDYISEELWGRIEDSNKFVMVDRRNLDRINTEINYQLGSGFVSDDFMVSITRQYGAEILIHGQMVSMGGEYRMTVYATDVERAASSQRAFNIRSDNRLASLLNVSVDEEIERAVTVMARAVDQRITIAVGRISYADTQTVSGLSAWLKNGIIAGAQRHRDKFQVASDSESADFAVASRGFTADAGSVIQEVVTGGYSPLDLDAEVSIHLVSTGGNRAVLASSRFVIPAQELERRRLTLLPEMANTVITPAEFDAKQQAVDPYAGRNNRWAFTITADVLDGIYRDGDYMTMRLYSAQDCYFRIVHVDVNGNTQVIYPTSPQDNNFIRAGETRRIPDNTRYRMGQPFGEEMILAAAYDHPFALNAQPGTGTLSADSITRSLTAESDSRSTMNPSATAMFSYTILPRQ
jgi:hypothetical protein